MNNSNAAEFGQNQHGTTRCSASLQQQSANHDNTYCESTITTAAALSTTTASSPTAAAAARYLITNRAGSLAVVSRGSTLKKGLENEKN